MKKYEEIANEARLRVLDMIYKAQTSHIGSNFSSMDILAVLFENIDLKKDRILFSKGWVAASAYHFLARAGVVPVEDLETYCEDDSPYIGLVEPDVEGIDFAGGSMGYGVPAGVGFALAKKTSGADGTIYVLMSDGELQIGTLWESALIAAHHKLDNLFVLVDNNKFQAMGATRDILSIDGVPKAISALGWNVTSTDGHDYEQLERGLSARSDRPSMLVCDTIKGKGVSFMENDNLYHYKMLSENEYDRAKAELSG